MSNEKKFNIVFITTNLINKKQYVGEYSTNNLNCWKGKNYLGSGRPYFENAKKKYGRKNFKREILDDSFKTKQEAFDAQEKYIIEYDTLAPNGYNLSPKGGVGNVGCFSEKTKKRLSYLSKGKNNPMYGRKQSIETIQKIRNKSIGRKHSLETRKKMSIDRKKERNSFYGKKHSKYSISLMSDNRKGKCVGENNHSSKTFIFVNPKNISFTVFANFDNFCQEHVISPAKMKRYINKGKVPNIKNINHNMLTIESINCSGWEVKCLKQMMI